MLKAFQCRAARAFLNWSQAHLAEVAGVGESTVRSFEGEKGAIRSDNLEAIETTLEAAGVEFFAGGVKWRNGALPK